MTKTKEKNNVVAIQGNILRDALISASACLLQERKLLDDLNVFPVPDGDTGTNMFMTMNAAAQKLSQLREQSISVVADVASTALLRNARGNSGVILSLLFQGFSKGLKGKNSADGEDLANALTLGVETAFKSIVNPVNGTILTVAKEAAEKGCLAAKTNKTATYVWKVICDEAEESLERTPDLLPVLKEACVVDAGGKGLCVVLRAMQGVFEGGQIVVAKEPNPDYITLEDTTERIAFESQDIKYIYCTEFIILRNSNNRSSMQLRNYLETIGDSIVVVDNDDFIKVHLHTNDPGKALQEAALYGEFENVKIDNMRIQHNNTPWVESSIESKTKEQENEVGFVAVAAGEGLQSLFYELGCDQVVSGGQTMNPSTDDFLKAIESTPAKVVFVLPNNKNIIMAAEQAIPLADRTVYVLPTNTIPQGISAMMNFDPDTPVEDNLALMMQAAEYVSSGLVTYATRDSVINGSPIKKGQVIALNDNKIIHVDNDIQNTAATLIKSLIESRHKKGKDVEFITLFYGENMTEEDAEAVRDTIIPELDDMVEVTIVNGKQPLYYYIISID